MPTGEPGPPSMTHQGRPAGGALGGRPRPWPASASRYALKTPGGGPAHGRVRREARPGTGASSSGAATIVRDARIVGLSSGGPIESTTDTSARNAAWALKLLSNSAAAPSPSESIADQSNPHRRPPARPRLPDGRTAASRPLCAISRRPLRRRRRRDRRCESRTKSKRAVKARSTAADTF